MKRATPLAIALVCLSLLGLGCSSSGNDSGDGGTVTVSVTAMETPFEVPVLAYGVFEASADWTSGDPYVGYAADYVVAGSAACTACIGDSEATWYGTVGGEYYVLVFVTDYNIDEEYSPLDPGNLVVGTGGTPVPQNFVLEAATTLEFEDTDFTQILIAD